MEGLNDFLDDNLSTGPSDDQEAAMNRLDPCFHAAEAEEEDWCANEVLGKPMLNGDRDHRPRTAA